MIVKIVKKVKNKDIHLKVTIATNTISVISLSARAYAGKWGGGGAGLTEAEHRKESTLWRGYKFISNSYM